MVAGTAWGDPARAAVWAVVSARTWLAVIHLLVGFFLGTLAFAVVVTGTALACGGYAVAILVYVLNRGRFHALVRGRYDPAGGAERCEDRDQNTDQGRARQGGRVDGQRTSGQLGPERGEQAP